MRASIIIVNYNHKEAILRCLESVLASLPPHCEVIVVDNASSDGSTAAIGAAFPQITLLSTASNGGFGAGCNLGARQAGGKYLVFLNPDTTVEKEWLGNLLAPFDSNPRTGLRIGLTTARILLADGTSQLANGTRGQANGPRRINVCGINIHLTGLGLMRGMGAPSDAFPRSEEIGSVSGAAFAIRRDLFDSLSGFDETMFLYVEDVDLSWRARMAGWTCEYVPSSIVFHDYSLKLGPGRIFHQERNRYLMLLKSLRWPTIVLLLPALALAEVVTWGFVLRKRLRAAEKLSAYGWIISHWPTIRRNRRTTQALRAVPDRELLRGTVGSLAFYQLASPAAAAIARVIFDPLFSVWRWLMLAFVWW